jgi:hypothetical protein
MAEKARIAKRRVGACVGGAGSRAAVEGSAAPWSSARLPSNATARRLPSSLICTMLSLRKKSCCCSAFCRSLRVYRQRERERGG